ncbi:MAG: dTDP-4-dehydrorhamnose reductase [Candidatus Marinimicrobia bacterium]|nr:dTDP-4-dehydrorhamnose reductase [Candidatus Neomarinimicrobiota bacterium]
MKIILIGARGMLGTDLLAMSQAAGLDCLGLDLPEVDITSAASLRAAMPRACDWVINCAAYTDVDGAESHPQQAMAINCEGPRLLARWCRQQQARLLHVSTDYVFAGDRPHPYGETHLPRPLGQYGASKWAGEQALAAEGAAHLIVRTQSLFGRHGKNFVRTIAERLRSAPTEPLRVVNDQFSAPTYTRHLAEALLRLLPLERTGVVHVAATGSCSWFEFARAIAQSLDAATPIEPVPAATYARPARRPAFSVLDTWRYQLWTGCRLPDWRAGLTAYLQETNGLSAQ